MSDAVWMFKLAGFLMGLLLGSFLNVCISRLPEHGSIGKPRSQCPKCRETIRWYDNVPLLSWLLLRARCRHCSERIPWRYPAVELATGFWFAVAAERLALLTNTAANMDFAQPSAVWLVNLWQIVVFAVAGFLLIGLMVMDWKTYVLPDAFTLTGIATGFFIICIQAIFLPVGAEDIHLNPQHGLRMNSPGSFAARGDVALTGPEHLVFGRLLAILAAAAIPLIVGSIYRALRGREGLGRGDVKLLAMIAALLGFWSAMLAMFLGVVLCAAWATVLLARRRADLATRLPFGSFLAAGGLVAALAGEQMIAWYRGLL